MSQSSLRSCTDGLQVQIALLHSLSPRRRTSVRGQPQRRRHQQAARALLDVHLVVLVIVLAQNAADEGVVHAVDAVDDLVAQLLDTTGLGVVCTWWRRNPPGTAMSNALGVVESKPDDMPGSDSRRPVICGDEERMAFCRSQTESAIVLTLGYAGT